MKNIPYFTKIEPASAKTRMANRYNSRQAPAKAAKPFTGNHGILAKPVPFSTRLAEPFQGNRDILMKRGSFYARLAKSSVGNH